MSSASGIEHAPRSASKVQSAWLSSQTRLARAPLALAGAAPLVAGALLALQSWLLAGVLDAALVHSASRGQLLRAHAPALLDTILETRPDRRLALDTDTVLSPDSDEAALRAAGAVVAAVDAALVGPSPRVFCAVRPPTDR